MLLLFCCLSFGLPSIWNNHGRSNQFKFGVTASASIRGGNVENTHEILREDMLYNRWRKLVNRQVQLPSKAIADFEIVSQGDRGGTVSDEAVLVFVWNSETKTAVLVREYMPSVHGFMNGLAAGMVEDKHESTESETSNAVETAAKHELEEECRLKGGTWYRLCLPTVMDKYTTTRLSVYLVIDPEPINEKDAKPRDEAEEGMQVVEGISASQLMSYITSCEMTVVGGWAAQLALSKLRELGEVS